MKVLEAHTGRREVGHTSANADGLVAALRAEGFSSDELVDAGLAYRRVGGGPLGDFYRQRVLIPIRDDQERVVGIIGRNVGDQQRWAKYKNPPCTAIYDKSVNVYQPLATPVDPGGQVIVVEGTLDAIPADIYIALGLAAQAARSRSKHPGEGQFRRAEHGASIATLRPIADESRVAL